MKEIDKKYNFLLFIFMCIFICCIIIIIFNSDIDNYSFFWGISIMIITRLLISILREKKKIEVNDLLVQNIIEIAMLNMQVETIKEILNKENVDDSEKIEVLKNALHVKGENENERNRN